MENLTKTYGVVHALKGVNLTVQQGEIHALLGGNGAGKTTLVKVLAGNVRPDSGTASVAGRELRFGSPRLSREFGIVTVFQELALVPDLCVAENLLDGHEPRTILGTIDYKRLWAEAEEILQRFELENVNPRQSVVSLSLRDQQMIEIARAFAFPGHLMLLDEPTSALSRSDVDRVFSWLLSYKQNGGSALLISHRMGEIETVSDASTVFRDGTSVATFATGSRSWNDVIALMAGRDLGELFPTKRSPGMDDTPILSVRHLKAPGVSDVTFDVHPGEIFGITGLDGQGQIPLLYALFGALRPVLGEMFFQGRKTTVTTPRAAIKAGIAFVPLDRRSEALHLQRTVQDNLSLPSLGLHSGPLGWMDTGAQQQAAEQIVDALHIRVPALNAITASLSGGNQQKVAVGRWLRNDPVLILLADPTRGVDVATKQEIYALLGQWTGEGRAVVLYSTDLSEVVGLCHRVAVMYEGHLQTVLTGNEMTEEALLTHSHGLVT